MLKIHIVQIIAEVQFEGPSKKPSFNESLLMRVLLFPKQVYEYFTAPRPVADKVSASLFLI